MPSTSNEVTLHVLCIRGVATSTQTCHIGLAAEAHLKGFATVPTDPRPQAIRIELQLLSVSRSIFELMLHYFCHSSCMVEFPNPRSIRVARSIKDVDHQASAGRTGCSTPFRGVCCRSGRGRTWISQSREQGPHGPHPLCCEPFMPSTSNEVALRVMFV